MNPPAPVDPKSPEGAKERVYILWGNFTRPRSLELAVKELKKPVHGEASTATDDIGDFFVGDYLPYKDAYPDDLDLQKALE